MLGGAGSLAFLERQNGCLTADTVDLLDEPETGTGARRIQARGCTSGADVDFYRILGGGHTWPGSPVNLDVGFGRKMRGLDASGVMVDFFLEHTLGGGE